ncbi:MAG TPA: peptidoglycan DD-metalloendopeptidase family protein [Polyangiaceae bacterium]|nr:peptidoglycan DD-metalloendopeptidase family protein [Polyangiaceae bacterium]
MMLARSRLARLFVPAAVLALSPVLHADAGAPHAQAASADEVARVRQSIARDEEALRRHSDELRREATSADARILARGRSYVRLSRAGLLPVGDGFEALVEHAVRLERLHHALETDVATAKRLAAERVAVSKELAAVRARGSTLDDEQRVLARAETALRAADERESAFAQAFESSSHTAVYGAVGPAEPGARASGFAELKGRLPFPIAGRSEIRPARRASSDGPGLEMRAAPGAAVRSVAAGRVAFADTYADYGKTVIIDHGRHFYTLSANLGAIDVAVGDEVGAGERIGSVADTGSGPRLYFEVRVGKDTVDPASWFGL